MDARARARRIGPRCDRNPGSGDRILGNRDAGRVTLVTSNPPGSGNTGSEVYFQSVTGAVADWETASGHRTSVIQPKCCITAMIAALVSKGKRPTP